MHLAKRSSHDRIILCEGIDRSVIDSPEAGDHRIVGDLFGIHAEIDTLVDCEGPDLHETAGIKEPFQSLTSSILALFMLTCDPFTSACLKKLLFPCFQSLKLHCSHGTLPCWPYGSDEALH